MFTVSSSKGRFDANKVKVLESGEFPYIVRMSSNNGQKGFINANSEFLNESNTISFGQDTATMFYQEKPYFTGDKIKILTAKDKKFNKKNAQFFILAMTKSFSQFSWGSSSFSVKVIQDQEIFLPNKNAKVDYEFMEKFISELEAEQVFKLEKYLNLTGLKDYKLTEEELQVIEDFDKLKFEYFNVTDIFTVVNTRSILSRDIIKDSGETPYLCASTENNGVSSYISYDETLLDKGNCVFIGGKTFVVTYQEKDFYSNDSHNLALYLKAEEKRTKLNQIYIATCVNQSLKHKYSWGDSISKSKIKKDKVLLPTLDNQPNFEIMKTFISAIQKLVIKDVVKYGQNKKITK